MKLRKLEYRRDIDGLRAVAVVSVIIFHINSAWLSGGFFGVDIFFVISGYLITLLLVKDISGTHTLDLVRFYERRISRIYPALLFMISFALIFGMLILAPDDLSRFLKSIIWSLFSVANMFFYLSIDTGYFSTVSSELPLLHLWSLGVEEQFYILWPFLVLFLVRNLGSLYKQMIFICILLLSSFFWAQYMQLTDHSFSYYMIVTRAWELLAGSAVAFLVFKEISLSAKLNEILSIIGLALIAFGFIFISKNDSIPCLMPVHGYTNNNFSKYL